MKSFKDNAGRTWCLDVNVTSVKEVEAETGVDLRTAIDPRVNLFEQLAADPVALVGVLWVLCKDQAAKVPRTVGRTRTETSDGKTTEVAYEETVHGITAEDFGRAMAGDAIDAASEALEGAVIDFFPKLRRELLKKGMKKLTTHRERAMQAAEEFLDSEEFEEKMTRRLTALRDSFGAALESSGSILAGGPSAPSAQPPTPESARPSSEASGS